MSAWRVSVPIVVVLLLSACASAQSDASAPVADGATTGSSCDQLVAADEMRAIVSSTEPVDISHVRIDDAGVLRDIACGIGAESGHRAVSVGLSMGVQPCSRPELFPLDPATGGWFATAVTNGGIAFGICTPDGATLQASYLSFEDVPGPSGEQMKSIAMQTLDQLDLLREIGMATAADDAPAADGDCVDPPEVLGLGGVPFEGCVLEQYPSDVGIVSAVAVDEVTTFSSLGTALEAAGLETVFCSDVEDGRYCGWNGEYGNVNQIELPAVSSDNRWGVDVVLLDVEKF